MESKGYPPDGEGGEDAVPGVVSQPSPAPAAVASIAALPTSTKTAAAAAASSAFNESNTFVVSMSASPQEEKDRNLALQWQAVEQLMTIFGFPPTVAQQAVDAVGWDVTTCYNYILDQNLAEDSGGPVIPIDNCPHVTSHVGVTVSTMSQLLQGRRLQDTTCTHVVPNRPQAATGSFKQDVSDDGSCPSHENWMCLECGAIRCSRYANGHALEHWNDTVREEAEQETKTEGIKANNTTDSTCKDGHCIAVSFSDLSVWCYHCNAYIKNATILDPLVQHLERVKFPEESKG